MRLNIGFSLYSLMCLFLLLFSSSLSLLLRRLPLPLTTFLARELFEFPYRKGLKEVGMIIGRSLFSFYGGVFFSVLLFNVGGNLLYTFAVTSEFASSYLVSFSTLIAHLLLGSVLYRLYLVNLWLPEGTPLGFAPLITLLELVSYLARIVSLGTRLSANILCGHILLKLTASFTSFLVSRGGERLSPSNLTTKLFLPLFSSAFLFAIYNIEVLVAHLQAYVLHLLSVIYASEIV